jgi:hypothetical protein
MKPKSKVRPTRKTVDVDLASQIAESLEDIKRGRVRRVA